MAVAHLVVAYTQIWHYEKTVFVFSSHFFLYLLRCLYYFLVKVYQMLFFISCWSAGPEIIKYGLYMHNCVHIVRKQHMVDFIYTLKPL